MRQRQIWWSANKSDSFMPLGNQMCGCIECCLYIVIVHHRCIGMRFAAANQYKRKLFRLQKRNNRIFPFGAKQQNTIHASPMYQGGIWHSTHRWKTFRWIEEVHNSCGWHGNNSPKQLSEKVVLKQLFSRSGSIIPRV